jgi:hypothetical protein
MKNNNKFVHHAGTSHTRLLFGVVQNFDIKRGTGGATVDDPYGKCGFFALLAVTGPYNVVANGRGPTFGGKMSAVMLEAHPRDTVVIEIFDHDGCMYVKQWCFVRDWLLVKKAIEANRELHRMSPTKFIQALRDMATDATASLKKSVAMPKRTEPRLFSKVIFSNSCRA